MKEAEYMEAIVDYFDGCLDEETRRRLFDAMEKDDSLRRMFTTYEQGLGVKISAESVDTEALKRRIEALTSGGEKRRARTWRLWLGGGAAVAAVVIVAMILSLSGAGNVSVSSYNNEEMQALLLTHAETSEEAFDDVLPSDDIVSEETAVVENSGIDDLSAVETAPNVVTAVKSIKKQIGMIGRREVFMLAVPNDMIEFSHNPADMLCGVIELPGLDMRADVDNTGKRVQRGVAGLFGSRPQKNDLP